MYRIVLDSCGELTPDMKADPVHFATAPLSIDVGGVTIADDETFDQAVFLARVAAAQEAPHSACPSPAVYMQKLTEVEADHLYTVTLSSQLSGSYNSAVLAGKTMRSRESSITLSIPSRPPSERP